MPDRDPFEGLRLPDVPLAPDPAFAAALRARLQAELRPTPDPSTRSVPAPEAPMTDTPTADAPRHVLSPYLAVAGGAAAIDFYVQAFGAIETMRFEGDDGRLGHAELDIGGSRIMLADEYPEMGVHGPVHYGGTPVMLHLVVADVDYTYQRAVDAGAEGQRPPADQGHGNRSATVVDPFGHRWMLSQPIEADRAETADADPDTTTSGFTVTGRAPVELGYLTLHVADRSRAITFFESLFAWRVEGGSQGGHVANTRFPLGLNDAPPAGSTTAYFRVDDIDVYAARVEELGGRVLARNDYDSGGSAECEDDQGTRFELWKPAPGY